jgi:hypothetical protein
MHAQAVPRHVAQAARPQRLSRDADAARQAILRRLAAPLKHDMVVNLQAVAMLAETLGARLERGPMEPTATHAGVGKLNRLARDAVAACLQVASWIDSAQDESVPLAQAVKECIDLLSGHLNFRGFRLSAQVPDSDFEIGRGATRNLVAGALLVLADTGPAPGELVLQANVSPEEATLTLACLPADAGSGAGGALLFDPPTTPLEWADLETLAQAESCTVSRESAGIVLRLPRARVTAPLQMAPV